MISKSSGTYIIDMNKLTQQKFAVFDMDGTLLDSMGYWQDLGREYMEARGFHVGEEVSAAIESMTMAEAASYLKKQFGLSENPEEIARQINARMARHYREDIPLKKGAASYLAFLKKSHIPMCVVTATEQKLAEDCLKHLGILHYFDFVLSCETIGKSKEEPDIYVLAQKRFTEKYYCQTASENPASEIKCFRSTVFSGQNLCFSENSLGSPAESEIPASDIIVFEDAPYCIKTAFEAGFFTVAIYEQTYAARWKEIQKMADKSYYSWDEALQAADGNHDF